VICGSTISLVVTVLFNHQGGRACIVGARSSGFVGLPESHSSFSPPRSQLHYKAQGALEQHPSQPPPPPPTHAHSQQQQPIPILRGPNPQQPPSHGDAGEL
jgi:hypothetical protein